VMEQLTEDHSLVNELLKTGKLSREEAETHPQRSVITRALGTDPDVDVDTFSVRAENGDLFLLCSDGLTDMVSEESILDVVERNRGDMDRALRALVKEANRGGGQDNITVVAFEISDGVLAHDGDTREQALPVSDDEDTLTEQDGVPVVAEPQPKVKARHLRRRILAWLVILVLLAAAALFLYLRFLR
jgi:PPM family protein phosphatase